MHVLTRRQNESIIINGEIILQIIDIRGDKVRIGVSAPKHLSIRREEVWLAIQEEKVVTGIEKDHQPFVEAIIASPYDDTPRLVYADWLEDLGDDRCEYLRLECELNGLRPQDALFLELRPRFDTIRARCPRAWLAIVGRSRIANCDARSANCPQRWELLTRLSKPGKSYCSVCDRSVYFCRSQEEVKQMTRLGERLAIDTGITRDEYDQATHAARNDPRPSHQKDVDDPADLLITESFKSTRDVNPD